MTFISPASSPSASAQSQSFLAEIAAVPDWTELVRDQMPEGVLHQLTLQDGVKVRVGIFRPAGPPKATMVLMTGYSEFIEKYFDTLTDFVEMGYLVVLPEWRGHGKSGGRLAKAPMRLHVKDFDQYRDDLHYVMHWLKTLELPQPVFGLAHSMGGQVALRATHSDPDLFKALALSAPMMDVHVDGFNLALLKILAPIYIALGQGDAAVPGEHKGRANKTRDINQVTNNLERFNLNEDMILADFDLNIEGRSVEWTLRAIQAMQQTLTAGYLKNISVPVFIGVAGEDWLVRSQATLEAVQHLPSGSAKLYQPAQHELLMEVPGIRDQFIADIVAHFDAYMD